MDFLERFKEHMEGLQATPDIIEVGLFKEDGDSVAMRTTPNTINERHMDRGKIYPYGLQILVHHKDGLFAHRTIEDLNTIYDGFQGSITSSDGSFLLESIHTTTTPNFVQRTSYGVLYTMILTAELYIGG